MQLSLTDILATQQVEKATLTTKVENARPAAFSGVRNFRDHLDTPFKHKNYKTNHSTSGAEANNQSPVTAENKSVETKPEQPEDTEIAGAETTIQNIEGTADSAAAASNQGKLAQVFSALKSIKDSGASGGNILATLLATQESGGQDAQVADRAATQAQNNGSTVVDIAQGLGDAIGQPQTQVATISAEAVNVLKTATDDGNDKTTLEIGKKLEEIKNAENGATQVPATINEVASAIINIAKTDAQKPDVVEIDVKSGQVDVLLKSAKDEKDKDSKILDDGDQTPDKNNLAAKDTQKAVADVQKTNAINANNANAQAANNNVTQDIANQNAANALQKAGDKTATNTAQKVEDAVKPKTGSDLFLQAGLNNETGQVPASHDFVKFQKYLDAVSNTANNIHANYNEKAESVMAQIKFGVSSVVGKEDNTISIQLHPKELGSVDVHMQIAEDGKTKITIMAEKTDTLNLLQKESTSLKGMLQDALQTSGSQLSFSFHDKNDEGWKQMINNSFSKLGNNSDFANDDTINTGVYNRNFVASDGLDIRV
jgi:hypothetical protein